MAVEQRREIFQVRDKPRGVEKGGRRCRADSGQRARFNYR